MHCQTEQFSKVWRIPTNWCSKHQNKITEELNVGQSDLKYYEVIHGVRPTY